MYVYCGTVYNHKDLEPTQMSIIDRLDKENVTHIHHGILCSHKKWWVHVLCRDMDESGNDHSQQTDTRTENQTSHVLTHRQVMNNENTWTQGGEHHTLGSVGEGRGGTTGGHGGWGGITQGEMTYVLGGWIQQTMAYMYLCNNPSGCGMCTCTPEPKVQWKKEEEKYKN